LIRRFVCSAVIFTQRGDDRFRGGADELQVALQHVMQRIERIKIERVADSHHQTAFRLGDRYRFEPAGNFTRHLVDDLRPDRHLRKVDEIHLRMRGERPRDVLLRQRAGTNQRVDNGVVAACFRTCPLNLRLIDQVGFEKDFENVVVVGSHGEKMLRVWWERGSLQDSSSCPASLPRGA
jgi:hypothetical protein